MHATSVFRSNIGLFKLLCATHRNFFYAYPFTIGKYLYDADWLLPREDRLNCEQLRTKERQSVLGRKESIWKRRQGRAISSGLDFIGAKYLLLRSFLISTSRSTLSFQCRCTDLVWRFLAVSMTRSSAIITAKYTCTRNKRLMLFSHHRREIADR